MSKIIFISGPSAMGKSCIKTKLETLGPILNINFQRVIISTSRQMRQNEAQGDPWWFEPKSEIIKLGKESPSTFLTVEITGGDIQGLDTTSEIKGKLQENSVLWCELDINWRNKIIKWLKENMATAIQEGDLEIIKVFFSPLSEFELNSCCQASGKSWEVEIEEEMLSRMLSRLKAGLDNTNIDKIKKRAAKAPKVFAQRNDYDCIIINHKGEENPEWGGEQSTSFQLEKSDKFSINLSIYVGHNINMHPTRVRVLFQVSLPPTLPC